MRDDDLDRIISQDDAIMPSSGFVCSVMDAVMREAAAPPAIPFPWKRALPGLGAWAVTLAASVITIFSSARVPSGSVVPVGMTQWLKAASSFGVGSIALALLMSLILVKASMHFTGASK